MMVLNLPNAITFLRIILIVPFVYALMVEKFEWAFYIFIVAGLSDSLDGWFARLYNCTSRFGAFIDPLADKLLLMLSFVMLYWHAQIPWWTLMVLLSRDVIIMIGTCLVYFISPHKLVFKPIFMSKLNTFLQVIFVFFILFELAYNYQHTLVLNIMMLGVLLTSIISLIQYMTTWTYRTFFEA